MAARGDQPLQRMRFSPDTLFDRMLSGWLAPFDREVAGVRMWDFDVKENDKEIVVRAEMPGFEENELDVQINNDVLSIKAEKEQKGDGLEEYRSFYRVITLPPGTNPENVQGAYRNGVLELHIPRAEGSQPRHIKIQGQQAATGKQGQQAGSNQGQQAASNQGGSASSEKAKK
jgi:HSP20 family protein